MEARFSRCSQCPVDPGKTSKNTGDASPLEVGKLPNAGLRIVAQDVGRAVLARYLEIPMVRGKPSVNDLVDLNASLTQPEPAGGFFAPVS